MVEEIIASFLCEECDSEFPSSFLLKNHNSMIHSGDRVTIKADLGIIKTAHSSKEGPPEVKTNVTEVTCEDAVKIGGEISSGNQVKPTVRVKRKPKCMECEFVPISGKSLELHMKRIHSPTFKLRL